jgi:aspartate/methionine/tyrosine aminotransferase
MTRAATSARARVSEKAGRFTESVIREMTRLAMQHGAINMAQGFPDFPAPADIKEAARAAIAGDINQYAITWGARDLREAIAEQFTARHGVPVDPERELTVCCGSTEAMISSMLAVVDPGDEVVIFEPFYENYGPDAILSGARPRFVRLRAEPGTSGDGSSPAKWSFDPSELAAAFGPATRAIIVNTPNNPTGKVFTREELEIIRDLCVRWNALAITDEIYEHILYDGARHVALASLDGMRERTVTINGLSKTYSVTGWRVGWAIAAPDLSGAIRKVHDFLTVGAAAPLQAAGAAAVRMLPAYYAKLAAGYRERRDFALGFLERAGFRCFRPAGAYYIMTDISSFPFADDLECSRFLVEKVGVAGVPGSSFYNNPADGARQVRFAFCKKPETLEAAAGRLARLPELLAALR